MNSRLLRISVITEILFASFSCSEPTEDLTTVFQPVLEINLKDSPSLGSIAKLTLVGRIQKNDSSYFAMYDWRPGIIYYFNEITGKISESFVVQANDSTPYFPSMISVLDWDRILYFNSRNQTLVTSSKEAILSEKQLNLDPSDLAFEITDGYSNLRFDTSNDSIILSTWVNYSKASNGDSLMDERYLYIILDTGSLEYRYIPIKPKYKRHTDEEVRIYDIMPYAFQDKKGRYIGFNSFLDEIMIYEKGFFKEVAVKGTNHPIERVYLPRMYTAEEGRNSMIGKRAHKIFYSSKHDAFVRRVRKWEIEGTREINTYLFEVLNDNLEVETTIDLGKQRPVFVQTGDNIYLKIFDRPSQKLTLYEFKG